MSVINTTDSIINVSFKLTGAPNDYSLNELNGLTYRYDIDLSNNIHDFMNNITYNIQKDFGVSTFEVVLHQLGENGRDLKQHLMYLNTNYETIRIGEVITNNPGFYIRPISITEQDISSMREILQNFVQSETCPSCLTRIMDNRLYRYFECEHRLCGYCYVTHNARMERENHETTCPICRAP